jgi:cell division protein FtsB
MPATVLNSAPAIRMSIQVVEAFVRLRKMIASNEMLARKITELEKKLRGHDEAIAVLFEEIRKLLTPPAAETGRRIGFRASR